MEKEKKRFAFLLKIGEQLPLLICFAVLIFESNSKLSVKQYEVLAYFVEAMSVIYVLITAKDIHRIIMVKIMKK